MSSEHHRSEAERLIRESYSIVRHDDDTCPEADRMLAEAQIHATLALAAALGQAGGETR